MAGWDDYYYDYSYYTGIPDADWRMVAALFTATLVLCAATLYGCKLLHDLILFCFKAIPKSFLVLLALGTAGNWGYYGGFELYLLLKGGSTSNWSLFEWADALVSLCFVLWALTAAYYALFQHRNAL